MPEMIRDKVNEVLEENDSSSVILSTALSSYAIWKLYTWVYHHEVSVSQRLRLGFFEFVKSLPIISGKVKEQVDAEKAEMAKNLTTAADKWISQIPAGEMKDEDLIKLMKEYIDYDKIDWRGGRLSGTTFESNAEITKLCALIYPQFMLQNPLHADLHKGLRKIEAEALSQVLNLYNAPKTGCALMTGGGSESLGLAVLAARNRAHSRGIRWPEVIMCRTAHSSIDKACHYFRIKLIKVDYDYSTWTANVKQMAARINRNTCLIIASAPDYPHGLIDDIQAISTLAKKNNIPCHVDACMGGFLLPFAEEAGFPLPLFDFRLPGVTSISADIHKYGCSPKGASVLMFRNRELRSHAIYTCTDWCGGVYATPTYQGSRSGGNIACAWGVMNLLGREGYVERAKRVIGSAHKLHDAARNIHGIEVVGNPQLCIVAFTSKAFDIYAILSKMREKGWTMGGMQFPPAVHFDITPLNTQPGVMDQFISDLREVVSVLVGLGGAAAAEGAAAIYGKAAAIPDRSIVGELASFFVENNLTIPKSHQ